MRSLSFRLTIWYAAMFTFCSLLVLMIFYSRVAYITMERFDKDLQEELNEFSEFFKQGNIEKIQQEIEMEGASEDESDIFLRIVADGKIIASTNMAFWGEIEFNESDARQVMRQRAPIFRTIKIPEKEDKARLIYGFIGPNTIMQIGQSMEEIEEYLYVFRKLLLMILFPIIIMSTTVGWFMAKKALSGIDDVARTAEEISMGAYEKRVHTEARSSEIDRLVSSFNRMVDKLHAVLRGMREINDNIAHDLRSPLTRIRGIAEMTLLTKSSKEDFEDMAASTIEECDNLINMINVMLDITEVEAGVAELKFEAIDLNKVITEACALFDDIAFEKGIQLSIDMPDSVHIRGDKGKVQRIFTNLLENAIKYTPAGGKVKIKVDMDNTQASIHVQDTGIGIPESDMPKIFDRFYRCDNSRTEPGVGLGLSLAKAFVDAAGGSISVNSSPHKGSTFIVMMPK